MAELFPAFIEARYPPTWSIMEIPTNERDPKHLRRGRCKSHHGFRDASARDRHFCLGSATEAHACGRGSHRPPCLTHRLNVQPFVVDEVQLDDPSTQASIAPVAG
jgi:hypothetical protein